jgi:hypothetical protein
MVIIYKSCYKTTDSSTDYVKIQAVRELYVSNFSEQA